MQIKDLELSRELSAEEQGAVEGGTLNDFLQNANTSNLLAEMKKQIGVAVLNGAVIDNTGGNFAFSADVTSNDTIDQYSDVDPQRQLIRPEVPKASGPFALDNDPPSQPTFLEICHASHSDDQRPVAQRRARS